MVPICRSALRSASRRRSRSSNSVGVALVTSGPGATNAVTGIATAYMDSIPLVVISGQVPTSYIGQDAFQECDTVGITRACVKHNFLVRDVRDIASTIKKAFYIASTGRPGPVVVDIPKDITAAKCKFEYPAEVHMRSYNPVVKGHQGQIKKAEGQDDNDQVVAVMKEVRGLLLDLKAQQEEDEP